MVDMPWQEALLRHFSIFSLPSYNKFVVQAVRVQAKTYASGRMEERPEETGLSCIRADQAQT